MIKWKLNNSFHKSIFERDMAIIESWNDVVFLYSKIMNDQSIYKKNYLFFSSSINAPFSKIEILNCLEFTFEMLSNDEFSKSLTKEDKLKFFDLFLEIQSLILADNGDTFSSSIS
jgi:hypothetical protein